MIKEGIKDNAQNRTTFVNESKGDADKWKAMNEVSCSVYPKNVKLLENKGNTILTNWVDAEGWCIRQGLAGACCIGFFSNAIQREHKCSPAPSILRKNSQIEEWILRPQLLFNQLLDFDIVFRY